ncbi:MAG: PfkB family carbohydrate kinase [Anaerolineae bacterium]
MDVICLGEALIDLPAAQTGLPLTQVTTFYRVPGGAPANVAVAVAKLGARAGFVGKVGDDAFGHFLEETLRENGVDTRFMLFDKSARTALAFFSLPTPNTREFMFYRHPSADMLLRAEELDGDYLRSTRIFHFGSISLISEPSRTATLEAVRLAQEGGALISYDPNLRLNLWPDAEKAREGMWSAVHLADMIKVNEEELEFMTGEEDFSLGSKKLMERGPKLCVVTRGPEGSYYNTGHSEGFVDSFRVETVDATGCGDGFVAGLFVGLLESEPLEELKGETMAHILRRANAVGALTSLQKGVIPALPTREQVDAFLLKSEA